MSDVLQIEDLTIGYKNKTILENVSLKIPHNKIAIILGANGSGKSTFLKALCNSTENGFDRKKKLKGKIIVEDKVIFNNKFTADFDRNIFSVTLQNSDRDYYEKSDTIMSVLLETAAEETDNYRERADKMIEYFNAENIKNLQIQKLSGGQMKLLSIMECLIREKPFIYLIDEPFNELDTNRAKLTSNYICSMREKRKDATFIVVTHCKKIPKIGDEVISFEIVDKQLTPCEYNHVLCLGNIVGNQYLL